MRVQSPAREAMADALFTDHGAVALWVVASPLLALFNSGRDTGVLVDVGYRNTHITPVVDGYTLLKDVERLELGGKHVTDVIHESMVSFVLSW